MLRGCRPLFGCLRQFAPGRNFSGHAAYESSKGAGNFRQPLPRFTQSGVQIGRTADLDLQRMDASRRGRVSLQPVATGVRPVMSRAATSRCEEIESSRT